MPFKAGDKVQLKTRGLVMNMDNLDGEKVAVSWTDHGGAAEQTEEYEAEMLKPADQG